MEAVKGLVGSNHGTDYEVVIVHDDDAPTDYLDRLREIAGPRLRVVNSSGPFNFSAKVNQGADAASGITSCSSTTTSR